MTERDPGFTRQELEDAILGQAPALTSDVVADAAGVPLDQARRLWRALGFPDAGDAAAFTDADMVALSTLVGAVDKGAIDFDTAVRLTRAVGQTMARLADWQVATLAARVEQLEAGEEATGSRIGSALRLAEQVGIPFETLLVYSWRRHLAAAVARIEALGAKDSDLHTTAGHGRVRRPGQLHRAVQHDGRGPDRRHGRDLRVPLRRRGRRAGGGG